MSTLTYNGITLNTISTTKFVQEAVYDPSGTDYWYTHFVIGVKAYFNAATSPTSPGESPAQTLVRVRKCLMTQCAQLTYTENGVDIIKNPADGVLEDVNHGPKPKHVIIHEFTQGTYLVEFEVETWLIECCSGDSLPYISNRWSETDTIDENMYTKRVIKGSIRFRADYINSKKFDNGPSADSYRGLVAPPSLPLQPAFRRVSQEFTVQEDGLALGYTIVDQEEYVMPPESCTKFEGEHTVTTSKGAVYSDVVSVKVWGNAITPKSTLIARAAAVVMGRIDLSGNKKIRAGYVRDKINENVVEIRVETFGGGRPNTFKGLNIAKQSQPQQLDYLFGDRRANQQPDPGDRGTANLAMTTFASYLSLCVQEQVNELTNFPNQLPSGEATDTGLTVRSITTLPEDASNFNTSEVSTGVYTFYEMEIDYQQNAQILQLPYMDTSLTACSFVPVSQATLRKIVSYKAERWGQQPTLPNNLTTDPNLVLLYWNSAPQNIDLAPDGQTYIYRQTGTYIYGVIDPTQEQFLPAVAPYIAAQFTSTTPPNVVNGLADQPGNQTEFTVPNHTGGSFSDPSVVGLSSGGNSGGSGGNNAPQALAASLTGTAAGTYPYLTTPIDLRATATGGYPPYTRQTDFGDGYVTSDVLPSHFYSAPGTHTVTLTIVDSRGTTSTATAGPYVMT